MGLLRFVFPTILGVILVGFAAGVSSRSISAQDRTIPLPAREDSGKAEKQVGEAETRADEVQVDERIEMLGSQRFAIRERAAMELMREGKSVIPKLKALAESTADPEIRLRATELARQIQRGDEEVRIAAFISGKSDSLDGWGLAQRVLGDTGSVRELYAELVRAHPDIALSLEGSAKARDRVIAMTAAAARVRNAQLNEGRFPTRADAVALLFPLIFDDVPISNEYESFLIRVLQTEAGTLLYKSTTLSEPYQRLAGGWARRSGIQNRQDVLWLLMSHDVIQALPLALDTLTKSSDPETLAVALQAIARFGDRRQANERITNLIHDERAVIDHGILRGSPSRTQLGDVAMATLAILYDIPLTEAGFEGASKDPKFGLRPEEVGFEVAKRTKRDETRKKILAKVGEKNVGDEHPAQVLVE